MNFEVIFTNAANQDFLNILEFIAKDNPDKAIEFIDKLEDRTRHFLTMNPFGGKVYKDNVRYIVFDNYIIVYEPNESNKELYIYMVSERHRDWKFIIDLRKPTNP